MSRPTPISRRNILAVLATAPLAQTTLAQTPTASKIPETVGPSGPMILPAQYGLTGHYSQDATAGLQSMFDAAPPGAIIDFAHGMDDGGDYRVTGTVFIRKPLSLRGRHSRIVGVMNDQQTDLIRYEPTTELRGVAVEGLRLGFNAGGRDALVFDGGATGVIGNVVSRCSISGGPGGYAVRLAGHGNHFNIVRDCTLTGTGQATGAVYLASADGNKLLDNVIAGIGTGVRISLVTGAYKTGIIGGAIVSRDGGVHLLAGQQVDIERVQFEQGTGSAGTDQNQGEYASHITIEGSGIFPNGEEVRDVRIVACNFGSGGNQKSAITLVHNARDVLIDENYFASIGTTGADITIVDGSVFWTRVGPNNRIGGPRGGIVRGETNRIDPKDLILIQDQGTGSYGVYKTGEALGLSAGWVPLERFAFWKSGDDILRFRSRLKGGETRQDEVLGRLPEGFRPLTTQIIYVPTDVDEAAILKIETDGRIMVRRMSSGSTLYFDQLSVPVVGRSAYASGPY